MNVLGVEPPYLIALTGSKSEFNEYVDRIKITAPRLVVKTLHGREMKDWPSTMEEIATKLDFPSYFGKNMPALSECLQDLEWLPGDAYLLVLYDAASVLSKETHVDVILFFNLLDRICGEWAVGTLPGANWERKQTPFHVLLCGNIVT
jgi:RNAse (barnase) inhibitor barstar